eukprot:gene12243-biopygen4169
MGVYVAGPDLGAVVAVTVVVQCVPMLFPYVCIAGACHRAGPVASAMATPAPTNLTMAVRIKERGCWAKVGVLGRCPPRLKYRNSR